MGRRTRIIVHGALAVVCFAMLVSIFADAYRTMGRPAEPPHEKVRLTKRGQP